MKTATGKLRLKEIDEDEEREEEYEIEEDDDEFYAMVELKRMKNVSYAFMANKFPNLNFRKNQPFRSKENENSFNLGTRETLMQEDSRKVSIKKK